jgi:hypothetical protein
MRAVLRDCMRPLSTSRNAHRLVNR